MIKLISCTYHRVRKNLKPALAVYDIIAPPVLGLMDSSTPLFAYLRLRHMFGYRLITFSIKSDGSILATAMQELDDPSQIRLPRAADLGF